MSDPNTDMPIQVLPQPTGTDFGFAELEMPDPVGWVVHLTENRPQQSQGEVWAWCKVTADKPGYSEIVFTETDGSTPADPYPKPTPDSSGRAVRLGAVVFKVFC